MPLDKDAEEALRLHNEARAEIHEDPRPPLVWSKTLTSDASSYAKKLATRDSGMKHSSHNERTRNRVICGENLAIMPQGPFGMADASRLWIEEKYKYKGEKMGVTGRDHLWGHYTEIICPNVTKVGIAMAKSNSGATYVVARYDKCQITGDYPWDKRKGEIFKNRKWKPVSGGWEGNGSSSQHSQRQGQGRQSIPRQLGSSGFDSRYVQRGPRPVQMQRPSEGGSGSGSWQRQTSDPRAGLMQIPNPYLQGFVQVQGQLTSGMIQLIPNNIGIGSGKISDETDKALRDSQNQGRRR